MCLEVTDQLTWCDVICLCGSRWGGSSSQFSLIIWDTEMKESFEFIVTTAQAADMAAIILDHIRTIMALQDGEA